MQLVSFCSEIFIDFYFKCKNNFYIVIKYFKMNTDCTEATLLDYLYIKSVSNMIHQAFEEGLFAHLSMIICFKTSFIPKTKHSNIIPLREIIGRYKETIDIYTQFILVVISLIL